MNIHIISVNNSRARLTFVQPSIFTLLTSPDVEMEELLHIPRSTVQYRRTSSFELLKRYLEEHADEWNDW